VRVRLAFVRRGLATLCAAASVASFSAPARADSLGPSCGTLDAQGDGGVVIRVLFAKNGTVQRYQVTKGRSNIEGVHDAINLLQKQYGNEGENAPPLQIVSFKKGYGGLQIPDKAVDSCGRTLSFQ
jgi:hypothetical protein